MKLYFLHFNMTPLFVAINHFSFTLAKTLLSHPKIDVNMSVILTLFFFLIRFHITF